MLERIYFIFVFALFLGSMAWWAESQENRSQAVFQLMREAYSTPLAKSSSAFTVSRTGETSSQAEWSGARNLASPGSGLIIEAIREEAIREATEDETQEEILESLPNAPRIGSAAEDF